jgi:hypothetical protein
MRKNPRLWISGGREVKLQILCGIVIVEVEVVGIVLYLKLKPVNASLALYLQVI